MVMDILVGFIEEPTNLTVAEGVEAIFHCQHPTADAISWRLNGTALLDSLLDDVIATSASAAGGIRNTLTITAHSKYNQTRVQCVAYSDDLTIMNTDAVNLTVQGVYTLIIVIKHDYSHNTLLL